MPTFRSPIIGSYNNRSFAAVGGKDQAAKGCIITPIVNRLGRKVTYYVEKRPGLVAQFTLNAGATGLGIYRSPSTGHVYGIVYETDVRLWDSVSGPTNIDCGILSAASTPYTSFTEVVISGITYILITVGTVGTSGTGWYLASDATTGLTFTGDTHTNTTIDNVSSLTGLYVGQAISGSGIAANTRIATITAPSTITTTVATTATAAGVTITREAVAKQIDSDFPADIVGGFAELDGWIGVMTYANKFNNTDLNTVATWDALNFLTASKYSDNGVGAKRYKDRIVLFSSASIEILYNAGNPSASPFTSSDNAVGATALVPKTAKASASAAGTLFWVGVDGNIYKFDGVTPVKHSVLGTSISGGANCYVTAFSFNKKQYLNIYAVTSDASTTYWYCIDDDTFVDPNFGTNASFATTFDAQLTYFLLGDTSGKVYSISENLGASSSFLDNASAFDMVNRISTDMETQKRKFPSELRILADVQASGNIAVQWSDDDGVTLSTARNISLTSIGVMFMRGLGSFEGTRQWKFVHNANTPNRVKAIEIDYEVAE